MKLNDYLPHSGYLLSHIVDSLSFFMWKDISKSLSAGMKNASRCHMALKAGRVDSEQVSSLRQIMSGC